LEHRQQSYLLFCRLNGASRVICLLPLQGSNVVTSVQVFVCLSVCEQYYVKSSQVTGLWTVVVARIY